MEMYLILVTRWEEVAQGLRSLDMILGNYEKSWKPFILVPDDYDVEGTILDRMAIFSYSREQLVQFRYLMDIEMDNGRQYRIRGSYYEGHCLRFDKDYCKIFLEFENIYITRSFFVSKAYIIDHRNTCIVEISFMQQFKNNDALKAFYTLQSNLTRGNHESA